jgi:DNA polymerase-1
MELLSAATIRHCIIADPGKYIFSADFDQIELRVAAALAGETSLIDAAKRDESLHKIVALKVFGEGYTPDQYRYSKNLDFGWLFGGGAKTLAEQTGLEIPVTAALIRDFEDQFPALTAYKRHMQAMCLREGLGSLGYKAYQRLKSQMYNFKWNTKEGKAARAAIQIEIDRLTYGRVYYVRTPFGRDLPVDLSKPYTIVNYMVQSCAADLMKCALLDVMHDPELEPTVLLPIHDELLGQAWRHKAEYYARRYGEVMSREFEGVPISASGKVYGRSWGDGYTKKVA